MTRFFDDMNFDAIYDTDFALLAALRARRNSSGALGQGPVVARPTDRLQQNSSGTLGQGPVVGRPVEVRFGVVYSSLSFFSPGLRYRWSLMRMMRMARRLYKLCL